MQTSMNVLNTWIVVHIHATTWSEVIPVIVIQDIAYLVMDMDVKVSDGLNTN